MLFKDCWPDIWVVLWPWIQNVNLMIWTTKLPLLPCVKELHDVVKCTDCHQTAPGSLEESGLWGSFLHGQSYPVWKVSGRIFDLIIKETIMCEVTAVTAAVMEDTCFQKSALTDRPPSISPPMKIHVLISSIIFIFCCSSLFCLYPLVRLSFLFQFDEHQPEKRAMINPEGGEIERGREWSVNGDRDVGTEALIQHF